MRTKTITATTAALALAAIPSTANADDGSDAFHVAVIGDTQQWVDGAPGDNSDRRMMDTTEWLAHAKPILDIRSVMQTGDLTNWGWLSPEQYNRADDAVKRLDWAGLPMMTSVGNHDTRAVGWSGQSDSRNYGGAAYADNPECAERLSDAECKSWLLVRQTQEFNQRFGPQRQGVKADNVFEAGKADNAFRTFEAGGTKWMNLNLEFAPRAEAVAWADKVVKAHPDHNVIVQTHHYLNGDGSISGSNSGYGSQSPQYIWNNLVRKNANVKMVFSGHTGKAAYREDVGDSGNRIVSMSNNDVTGDRGAALRLVKIDPSSGRVQSALWDPKADSGYPEYGRTVHLKLIR